MAPKESGYNGSVLPRGDNPIQVDIYNERRLRAGDFEANFPQPAEIKNYKRYLINIASSHLQAFNEVQRNRVVDRVLDGLKTGKYTDQVGRYHDEKFIKYLLETEREELSLLDTKDTVWS